MELKCGVDTDGQRYKADGSVERGKPHVHFVEVMACPGGVWGEADNHSTNPEYGKNRGEAIYAEDAGSRSEILRIRK